MSALVRLYPAAWRARYGAEFETLLAERPATARDLVDIVVGALDARLSPQVADAPAAPAPLSSRISGASAILGGLVWCVVILLVGIQRVDGDYTFPVVAALGLMLLSLPGRYMRRYSRQIALGVGAVALAFLVMFLEILPWGPWLLVPFGLILGAIGPGAFALAAVRAGFGVAARWRLIALSMPLPVLGLIGVTSGLTSEGIAGFVAVVSLLPLGLAWMFAGARIAAAKASNSMTITGGLA